MKTGEGGGTNKPGGGSNSEPTPVHDMVSLIQGLRLKAAQERASDPVGADRMLEAANVLEVGAWQTAIDVERARLLAVAEAEDKAKLERYKFQLEWHMENTRALVQLSQGAMRAAALVNAGAAVAILAFLGSKAGEGVSVGAFAGSLALFAAGVVAATLATGTAYWSQLLYGNSDEKLQQRGKWPHGATVVLYVLAIVSFGLGCWKTYDSFLTASATENVVPCSGIGECRHAG